MIDGYWGMRLRIDLSHSSISKERIEPETCRKLLGGVGFGLEILLRETSGATKPLGSENRLVFAVGPFQAARIPGSGKFIVVSRSPLTEILGVAAAGGNWGVMLKKAGYEVLLVQGRSPKPVYIWISDDNIEIRDATEIWGKDALETCDIIREELNEPNVSVACIGPAGEKKVAIANIMVDKHSSAGRCGLGAVMGSKNLKAIAVKGTQQTKIANYKDSNDIARELMKRVAVKGAGKREHGTPAGVISIEHMGDLPIKYWTGDRWEKGAEKIGAPRYTKELNAKPRACANCPVACHRHIKLAKPEKYAVEGAGPEYEALGMLGSCNLVDDLGAIAKANDLCNRYGIDVIGAGAFIAFATECYERGLLTEEHTNGLKLRWGDGDLLVTLVQQLGEKSGLGELFAHGIKSAANRIGGEANEIAVHVKGLDLPAHDPRAFFSLAVGYATNPRGACHIHGPTHWAAQGILLPEAGISDPPDRFTMEGKERIVAAYHDLGALFDSLTMCIFAISCGVTLTDILNSLIAITGWSIEMDELLRIGRRVSTLERHLNVVYGITRKDDKLPKRMFTPAEEGTRTGKIPEPFEPTLKKFYELRGWDEDGRPTRKTLNELGILR